jgi:hypothetical protein
MTSKKLDEIVEEITKLLDPVKEKATIVFIAALGPNEGIERPEFAIFGNLDHGKNQELVKLVAMELAMQGLMKKMEVAMAEEEAKGKPVN